MKVLNTMVLELFGLFVDDGSLAIAMLVLLGSLGGLVQQGLLSQPLVAALLIGGTILALVENVWRTARRGIPSSSAAPLPASGERSAPR